MPATCPVDAELVEALSFHCGVARAIKNRTILPQVQAERDVEIRFLRFVL